MFLSQSSERGSPMNWQEACENPILQNLPFKIELNEWGQIVMSPVKVYHSRYQGKIANLLGQCLGEVVVVEFAIELDESSDKTLVADVGWISQERFKPIDPDDASLIAPEICVEVVSASNTQRELLDKRLFYFGKGALEFWRCDREGKIRFFDPASEIKGSKLAPDFPKKIELGF